MARTSSKQEEGKGNGGQPGGKKSVRQTLKEKIEKRFSIPIETGEGGLLVQSRGKLFSIRFFYSVLMELICTFLFALLGANPFETYFIPVANGIALAVLIYIAANVSGGHLNPCVTFATMLTGHISILKGIGYVIAQIVGSALASCLTVALRGGAGYYLGMGDDAPGCFYPHPIQGAQTANATTHWQAAGWELIFTFILVSTVYAVAIGKPNFGNVGPLIIGLSLYACAASGFTYTGASLNIARTLGPVIAFQCHAGDAAWYYVIAELIGGLLAGIMSWPLYGTGQDFMRLFDKDSTPDEGEADEHDDGENDVETGEQTPPKGNGMQDVTLREQYSPSRTGGLGPYYNGSLPAVYIGNVLYEPVTRDIPVLATSKDGVTQPGRVTAMEE